jgi:Ca2+/H+ antiporter
VAAINGASLKYEVPMAFLSMTLLPMVGGIAEFAAAVQFAMKAGLWATRHLALEPSNLNPQP